MAIGDVFQKEFTKMKKRNWDHIYVCVDLHDTCIESNYVYSNTPTNVFESALEPLRRMSESSEIKLIMWTCSHPEQVLLYNKMFKDLGIHFDYFNENPEVKTQGPLTYGCYDKKFYTNVILDDKAGFVEKDWDEVLKALNLHEFKCYS